jgi:hypothetical protein
MNTEILQNNGEAGTVNTFALVGIAGATSMTL